MTPRYRISYRVNHVLSFLIIDDACTIEEARQFACEWMARERPNGRIMRVEVVK
jgi:hypothetical protein